MEQAGAMPMCADAQGVDGELARKEVVIVSRITSGVIQFTSIPYVVGRQLDVSDQGGRNRRLLVLKIRRRSYVPAKVWCGN